MQQIQQQMALQEQAIADTQAVLQRLTVEPSPPRENPPSDQSRAISEPKLIGLMEEFSGKDEHWCDSSVQRRLE